MNFCFSDTTIDKSNTGNALEFSPSSRTILFAKPPDLTDSPAYRNRFDIINNANDLKGHWA